MLKDDLVEEVRKARQEQAAKWNFDLKAILADARKRQAQSGHKVVSFATKRDKADTFQQLVAPERLAHSFVGRIGEVEFDRGASGFGLRGQQCFELLVRRQQGFKPLAEGAVITALAVEPRRPLQGRFRQRQLEQ
jgi:hypothetical protein